YFGIGHCGASIARGDGISKGRVSLERSRPPGRASPTPDPFAEQRGRRQSTWSSLRMTGGPTEYLDCGLKTQLSFRGLFGYFGLPSGGSPSPAGASPDASVSAPGSPAASGAGASSVASTVGSSAASTVGSSAGSSVASSPSATAAFSSSPCGASPSSPISASSCIYSSSGSGSGTAPGGGRAPERAAGPRVVG